MTTDIKLDSDRDLYIENGQLALFDTQQESTRQKVDIYLNLFRGESFWAIDQGMQWIKNDNNPVQLLGKISDKRFIDVAIREAVAEREGILNIVSYESTWDRRTRVLSVSFDYEVETGDIISVDDLQLNI